MNRLLALNGDGGTRGIQGMRQQLPGGTPPHLESELEIFVYSRLGHHLRQQGVEQLKCYV
jgi:hypothetical protein